MGVPWRTGENYSLPRQQHFLGGALEKNSVPTIMRRPTSDNRHWIFFLFFFFFFLFFFFFFLTGRREIIRHFCTLLGSQLHTKLREPGSLAKITEPLTADLALSTLWPFPSVSISLKYHSTDVQFPLPVTGAPGPIS